MSEAAQTQVSAPNPGAFFMSVNAYQRTAALKAAVELGVFGAISDGKTTASEIASRCRASERGVRILCDYLVTASMLAKNAGHYSFPPELAPFLTPKSPAYLGGIVEFLLAPDLINAFAGLTSAVKNGRTSLAGDGTVDPDDQVWVNFARAMAPMMFMPAEQLAKLVNGESNKPTRILDIAAGHGLFGIAFAKLNPNAHVTAQDWAAVLDVARENAAKAGVGGRYDTLPGDAFKVDFGSGYDIVLLTNILHHFDSQMCEKLLTKVRKSLAPGGRAVILEFIPNDDRVTPIESAGFALIMLATTPAGDAYTYAEYERMLKESGFASSEFHPLPPTIQQVVIGRT
jgi:ubiquinone/menaquinone biosynthesis C-methylase UbiE